MGCGSNLRLIFRGVHRFDRARVVASCLRLVLEPAAVLIPGFVKMPTGLNLTAATDRRGREYLSTIDPLDSTRSVTVTQRNSRLEDVTGLTVAALRVAQSRTRFGLKPMLNPKMYRL